MTAQDVVTFLKAIATAFPDVRFIGSSGDLLNPGPPYEIFLDDVHFPDLPLRQVALLFVGPTWELDVSPRPPFGVRNFPRLNVTIRVAEFWPSTIPEVGRKVLVSDLVLLNANHYADGPDGKEGKAIIDKVFRLHRKLVDNKVVPLELRTGEVAGPEETDDYWYGADMARQCLDETDRYLFLRLDRENDRFWGYKPAKVPVR